MIFSFAYINYNILKQVLQNSIHMLNPLQNANTTERSGLDKSNKTGGLNQSKIILSNSPQRDGGKLPSKTIQIKQFYIEQSSPSKFRQLNIRQEITVSNYEDFIQNRFFSHKLASNTFIQSQIEKLIQIVSLMTENQRDRQKKLNQFLHSADQNLLNLNFLIGVQDKQLVRQAKAYFSQVLQQLLQKNKYLSFKGANQLINFFLEINKRIYYQDGKFNMNHITEGCKVLTFSKKSQRDLRFQPYFQKMIKQITQLKLKYFEEYGKIFDVVLYKIRNGSQTPFQKENHKNKFSQNLWTSFVNILQADDMMKQFEINTLLKGLNLCLRLKSQYFGRQKAKKMIKQFLPLIKYIQSSQNLKINEVQRIILELLLIFPYHGEQSWDKDQSIKVMIQNFNFNSLSYFRLLTNNSQQDFQNADQLTRQSSLLFLQKIIEIHMKNNFISPNIDDFIFRSLCNIFADNPSAFWSQKQVSFQNIFNYILQAQNNTYDQSADNLTLSIHTVKFVKLLNLLCATPKETISTIKFKSICLNQSTFGHLFRNILQIIQLPQNEELMEQLRPYNLDTQPVYQFIHRLIIEDSQYFVQSKNMIEEYFEDISFFYVEVIVTYLRIYSNLGQYNHICLTALNKIIENSQQSKLTENILKELSYLQNQIHQQRDRDNNQHMTELQQIIQYLFQNKTNFKTLGNQLLLIIKFHPQLINTQWFKFVKLGFKLLLEKYHPYNLSDYSIMMINSLRFVKRHPKTLKQIEKCFDFRFVNNFLCQILGVTYENGEFFNKFMRNRFYSQISVAIRLLNMIAVLYLEERQRSQFDFVPNEIRVLLEIQNKNGNFQIMGNYVSSYSAALIVVYLSKQFEQDTKLQDEFPNLRNEILQLLVHLNSISIILKCKNSLTFTQMYNRKDQFGRKQISLQKQIQEQILKNPSYLGVQYLIACSNINCKFKKSLLQRIKMVKVQRNRESTLIKSQFMSIFWKQSQRLKSAVNIEDEWEYLIHEICEIKNELNNYVNQENASDQQNQMVNQILNNLYKFSIQLQNSSVNYYTSFIANFHSILLNLKLNLSFILLEKRSIIGYSNYCQSLFYLLNCRSFLPKANFQKLVNQDYNGQSQIYIYLKNYLVQLIELTLDKNYNTQNDDFIFQIIQFGCILMIDLGSQLTLKRDFHNLSSLLLKANKKVISVKQILVIILLNGQLSRKISSENVNFNCNYWPLMMNVIQSNYECSSMILLDLQNIYSQHPLFFISACNYLVQTAKTKTIGQLSTISTYKDKKYMIDILTFVLSKAITKGNSFHSVWVVQIFIEIIQNSLIDQTIGFGFYESIRKSILHLNVLHQRIQRIVSNIGYYYDRKYANLWKCSEFQVKQLEKKVSFSEKIELLSYLRLLTFISFDQRLDDLKQFYINEEKTDICTLTETKILESMLNILPLISKILIEQQVVISAEKSWEQKLISGNLTLFAQNDDQLYKLFKGKNSFYLLDKAANIEFASLVIMWLPKIKKQPKLFEKYYMNQQNSDQRVEDLLQFMFNCKFNLESYSEIPEKMAAIMQKFNVIYQDSVQISKQMLFTNSESLTSNLNINYQDFIQKLRQDFILVNNVIEYIFYRYKNVRRRQDRLIKLHQQILKRLNSIRQIINKDGCWIQIPDNESQRRDFNNTKSITIRFNRS